MTVHDHDHDHDHLHDTATKGWRFGGSSPWMSHRTSGSRQGHPQYTGPVRGKAVVGSNNGPKGEVTRYDAALKQDNRHVFRQTDSVPVCVAVDRLRPWTPAEFLASHYCSVQNQFERFREFLEFFRRFEFEFCRCEFFFLGFEFLVCSCECAVACLCPRNSISNVVASLTIDDNIYICM